MKADAERDYTEYVTGRLPALRRVATQLAGDAHRGDDLVQQTITKLYTRWTRAAKADNLDAYTHRILVRTFLDERRLGWARVRLDDRPTEPRPTTTADEADRVTLRAALARLPRQQRAVLVLRFLADHPVDTVADILQISPGTVKSHTAAGVAALRRLLPEYAGPTIREGQR
ncbi:SigE family RNA polymerase sigma factor [Luedemannella flava]|uniref:SigE family RNA polymerase sigma factor n=1 Tax=Luedemannella flava TaxID=349316 RepID=A0ABP4YC88_9ACTN